MGQIESRVAWGQGELRGGCDCGAVRYELEIESGCDDVALSPSELMVRAREFRLLSGDDSVAGLQLALGEHRFYCELCGVCSFSRQNVGQRGAEFYAVNLHCLDVPRGIADA